MVLRKHPLFNYRGVPSWPPVWRFTGGLENQHPPRREVRGANFSLAPVQTKLPIVDHNVPDVIFLEEE
jgi:hypothetical protein